MHSWPAPIILMTFRRGEPKPERAAARLHACHSSGTGSLGCRQHGVESQGFAARASVGMTSAEFASACSGSLTFFSRIEISTLLPLFASCLRLPALLPPAPFVLAAVHGHTARCLPGLPHHSSGREEGSWALSFLLCCLPHDSTCLGDNGL